MNKGKNRMKLTKRGTRVIILIAALVLVLGAGIGLTIAFLTANTDPLTNTFTPAKVTCAVEETFENNVKTGVKIKNTGDVDAYIRATVVVNWIDQNGNVCAQGHDVPEIRYNSEGDLTKWSKKDDGFWYYSDPVAPNGLTDPLINTATTVPQTDGCTLQIQILASAIQADGMGVTANTPAAWGIDPTASGSGN